MVWYTTIHTALVCYSKHQLSPTSWPKTIQTNILVHFKKACPNQFGQSGKILLIPKTCIVYHQPDVTTHYITRCTAAQQQSLTVLWEACCENRVVRILCMSYLRLSGKKKEKYYFLLLKSHIKKLRVKNIKHITMKSTVQGHTIA